MDLVNGLGDTTNVIEVACDDIGRIEVFKDRVRITMVCYRDGGIPVPTISCVWTVAAWKDAQAKVDAMRSVVYEHQTEPRIPLLPGARH